MGTRKHADAATYQVDARLSISDFPRKFRYSELTCTTAESGRLHDGFRLFPLVVDPALPFLLASAWEGMTGIGADVSPQRYPTTINRLGVRTIAVAFGRQRCHCEGGGCLRAAASCRRSSVGLMVGLLRTASLFVGAATAIGQREYETSKLEHC